MYVQNQIFFKKSLKDAFQSGNIDLSGENSGQGKWSRESLVNLYIFNFFMLE